MIVFLALCLIGTVLCVCAFCHALCDALRAVQGGGDPKTPVVRMQVGLSGAVLLPVAAVIRVLIFMTYSF